MTNRVVMLLWIVLVLVAVATVGASLNRARRAEAISTRRVAGLRAISGDVAELTRLRALFDPVAESVSNSARLAPLVGGALGASGLLPSTLSSLSPELESLESVGDSARPLRTIRRRATLVLTPLTLPQLGRFLSAWRERPDAGAWTVSRLDIEPRRDQPASPGSDLPLRAVIGLESLAIEPGTPLTTLPRATR